MKRELSEYFDEQKNWSKRKLDIISSYLNAFVKILGSNTSHACVYYIDGFAGRGNYKDGTKGSPVLAAELAQKFRDQNKVYQLQCINVEADNTNFQNLETATSIYERIVLNLQGTFASNIPKILQQIGKCPAFFFIDPFGVKGTDWQDLIKILHRNAKTDLWLRFDHKTVRRLSGFFDSGSRGAERKVSRLLNLYGIHTAESLFQRLDGNSCEERINNAVNYYVERLELEFRLQKDFGFSAAFPIVSLDGQNKYYLVFAASHPKAVILASETIYTVERNRPQEMQDYAQKKTGQMPLFSVEPSELELSNSIAEDLAKAMSSLCSDEKISRQDIYMRLLTRNKKKWFGRISSAHI